MMRKRALCLTLCLALLLAGLSALGEAEAPAQTRRIQLGSTRYYVLCDASYNDGGITDADLEEDMVAYWVSDETPLDFDVYQFSKEGLPDDLAEYVQLEAAEYAASTIEPQTLVNDIPVGWYRAVESYEDREYETLTCVMDADSEYVEIVFWLDGPTAEAEADAILKSLSVEESDGTGDLRDEPGQLDAEADDVAEEAIESADETDGAVDATEEADGEADDAPVAAEAPVGNAEAATRQLRLGTSAFTVTVPASFTEGEMTQEDIDDDQVGYYFSHETLLDFDVYQFSKEGYPEDLADYVVEEASGYNSVSELVTDGRINGIPAGWYRTVEVYQDAEFNTLTYVLDGGGEYVEICFWLDGDSADAEAGAIINSLSQSAVDTPAAGEGPAATPGDGADAIDTAADSAAE